MLCQEWTLVKRQNGVLTAEPLKCKCWSCEYCAPIRSRALVRQAFMGRPDTFLTLTVNPRWYDSVDERARALARAWRLLRLRAIRKYKLKNLPFLAVFEKTKAGEPHLHILLRVKWIDQRWVSDQMRELIGAPIVDIRRIVGKGKIAAYVAKYVAKDPSMFKGTKRYWCSQDYEMPDPREDEGEVWEEPQFKVVREDCRTYVSSLLAVGFHIVKETRGVRQLLYDWHYRQELNLMGKRYA